MLLGENTGRLNHPLRRRGRMPPTASWHDVWWNAVCVSFSCFIRTGIITAGCEVGVPHHHRLEAYATPKDVSKLCTDASLDIANDTLHNGTVRIEEDSGCAENH